MVFGYVMVATLVVSAVSLVGILAISVNKRFFQKILFALVSFAVGALLAAAFLDLIPEAVEEIGETAFGLVLLGILLFFVLEKLIYWHHCHHGHGHHECGIRAFTYLNLVGDAVHNFTDGVIIATSFISSVPLGVTTTIAVIAHEVPQELGDFGILVYGGFSQKKALAYNFLSALAAVAGALATYFFTMQAGWFSAVMHPIAAGGFIYIAGADLLPELHAQARPRTAVIQLLFILLGIAVVWGARLFLAA